MGYPSDIAAALSIPMATDRAARNAAGIGIREDVTPITTNRSQFVPHFFE